MQSKDFVVFALDTSKMRTGWAVLKGHKVIKFGAIVPPPEFHKITYQDPEWSKFLLWYNKKIWKLCSQISLQVDISFAVLEDLHIQHKATAKILQEVQAVAKLSVAQVNSDIPLNPIHNSTAKSSIGLAGMREKDYTEENKLNAKTYKQKPIKIVCIDKINELYGVNLTYNQDDESDAIMLAHAMLKIIEEN